MTFTYVLYLLFVLIGCACVLYFGKVKFNSHQIRATALSLIVTAFIFIAWDILAVSRGHWSFGLEHTLNIVIINQPIEEIKFFLVVPFFGIVVYRFVSGRKSQ